MRRSQIERMLDREETALVEDLNAGRISNAEFNEAMRDLQREAREAYQEDLHEAQERVRDEWGQ